MPVELMIGLLAVVIAIAVCIWILKNRENSLPQGRQESISDDPLIQSISPDHAIAIAEIESIILANADGQELTLTRPDAIQNAEKKYREISIRGSSAMAQVAQGTLPVLAQAQTLSQIAKAAPNGLFTATAPIQDLMKYADGTVGSIVLGNKGIVAHSGFAEITLKGTNPAAVIGGAMTAMAMISGQYYMTEISEQLRSVDQKLNKLIGYHHNEKVGVLKNANSELYGLTSKVNADAADIIACQRLGEKCGEIYYEYQTRLDSVRVHAKGRWINKAKELRELSSSIDENELNFTIQMCCQASALYEKCKLAEIAVRMKIGSGQERFIAEKIEGLRRDSDGAFHRNTQQYIDEKYTSALEKVEKFTKTAKMRLQSGHITKEAESIRHKKDAIVEAVADDGSDIAQSLLRSLSEPKEALIMLSDMPNNQRVFVLDE